jgi:hypothetical protein
MAFKVWERWGPITGLLAILCWLVAFIPLGGNSPNTTDSNTKIVTYYASHSHQVREIAALLVFLAGTLLFLGFLGVLRSRLFDAEGAPGKLTAIAFASGVSGALLLLAGAVLFTMPALAVNDTSKFRLDPNTFRILDDGGFALWIGGTVIAAVLVWITSVIALRSSVLPRWFALLGLLAAILQLFAVFFVPILIFWGWILIGSVILLFRKVPART